jgi:hypothetical protein
MAHTFTNLLTHVVFSTKNREALITPNLKSDLRAYMGGIVRNLDSKVIEPDPRLTPWATLCRSSGARNCACGALPHGLRRELLSVAPPGLEIMIVLA